MIERRRLSGKGAKGFIAIALLGCGLLAAHLPQPEQPACEALTEDLYEAVHLHYETGTGDWAELEARVAQAHRCFGDARTVAHAGLFDYESSIFAKQRRFGDALGTLERFFADYAEVAEPEVTARMYRRRGYLYERLGWTAEMLAEYARAAAMADRLSPSAAIQSLRDASRAYYRINDLETSRRYLVIAESLLVPLHEAKPGKHDGELGIIRSTRALILLNEGEQGIRPKAEATEAAAPLMEGALRLFPATQVYIPQRARTLLQVAEMHWMNEDPEAALAPIAEAYRLRPWFQEASPQLVTLILRKSAYTHYLLGNHEEARRTYETALALAQEAEERKEIWWALIGLGDVAEASESEADGLRRAEAYYRQAAALIEEERRSYGTQDWSVSAWEETQKPYLRLTRVLLRQGRAAEAFLTLDATRARHLRDLRTATRLRATLDLRAAARLDSLSSALTDAREALQAPSLSVAERTALEVQEVTLQHRIDEILGAAEREPEALTLEALQRALEPRRQVLLTYFLDDDLPTAFVVRADTFAAVPLDVSAEALQGHLRALDELWTADTVNPIGTRLTPFHELYEVLYAPVAPLVPDGAPLVVIPDQPLDQVPFGLLLEHAHPPFDYADAPYLLRRHPITVELAAALLTEPAPATQPSLDLLALGRSRFESASPPLENLPNVGEELRRLRRHVGNARFALDEEATEAFFDAHRGGARVIHLASHAFVNPQLPLYSRILLWDDPESDDDGTLHLYELYDRPLNADLVTLSGCFTARGRARVGEGMMGLQHAFRSAGARATLATLWKAEDATTAELMDHFYRHLRRGLPKDEALRQAQLEYLDAHEGAAASPFFWAPLVLYGDPAPVALVAGAPSMALWLPGGLLLVLAGLALPRFTRRMRARRSGNG